MTLPAHLVTSDTKTNATMTLVFGPGDTVGTTYLQSLLLTLTGGSTAVIVTITGLVSTDTNNGTSGEMIFSMPPGTVLPMLFPENGLIGTSQLTLSATPGAGQTLSAVMMGKFE